MTPQPSASTAVDGNTPQAAPRFGLPQPVGALQFILLYILTLGLYWDYRVYKAGEVYETLSGERSNFRGHFWLYFLFVPVIAPMLFVVATLVLTQLGGGAGDERTLAVTVLSVSAIFFLVHLWLGGRLIAEIFAQRDKGVLRHWQSIPALTTKRAHVQLWLAGRFLAMFLIGLPLVLLQAYLFMKDYNQVVQAIRSDHA